MSRGKAAFFATTGLTLLGIVYIHHGQKVERENLHKGVLRDRELYKFKIKELQERGQQSS